MARIDDCDKFIDSLPFLFPSESDKGFPGIPFAQVLRKSGCATCAAVAGRHKVRKLFGPSRAERTCALAHPSSWRRARAVDVEPSIIVTSPYRRARETAEVAAEILSGGATLVESRALTPDSSPEAVWDAVRQHKGEPQLMLVGHEPLLSAVYAYLLGSPAVQIDVKKGSLGRIDVDRFGAQPRGVLRWLIYPKLAGD